MKMRNTKIKMRKKLNEKADRQTDRQTVIPEPVILLPEIRTRIFSILETDRKDLKFSSTRKT